MIRDVLSSLDLTTAFWVAVVWLLVAWFCWALVRVGASGQGQGRRNRPRSQGIRQKIGGQS